MTAEPGAPADLDESTQLGAFIADVSECFAESTLEAPVDADISYTLGRLARLLRADRAMLLGCAPAAQTAWVTSAGYAEESTPRLGTRPFTDLFPWHYRRLCEGHTIAFSDASELPDDAAVDRESARTLGVQSMLSACMADSASGRHCLIVQALRTQRSWPADYGERLGRLAAVFMDLLRRKRVADTRREIEEGHADLLQLIHAIVWRADAETFQTRFVSKEAEMLGYPTEAWTKIPGLWVEHIHPDDRERVIEFTSRATRERRNHDFEYRMVVPGGRIVWLRNIAKVVTHQDGSAELIGLTIDITRRKLAELEAVKLRHQLNQSLRVSSLGELAATLAHELNQPLGAVVSNAEAAQLLLDRQPSDLKALHAILGDIAQDASRAGAILHRVGRLLQRQTTVDMQPLDLPRLVDEIVRVSSALAHSRHIELTADVEPDLPRASGDLVQIQQVLINLILNAMDAVADLPLTMRRVSVKAARAGGDGIEMLVADTGRGIPADAMPRLFEPFFSTKHGGMGMGLPICRTIVESHGGDIAVENNTAGGVTVRVRLPLADAREGGAA